MENPPAASEPTNPDGTIVDGLRSSPLYHSVPVLERRFGARERIESGLRANEDTKPSDINVLIAEYLEIEESRDNLNTYEIEIVSHFRCPITQCFFKQPVIASDGYTYEMTAILKHMSTKLASLSLPLSPITNKTLKSGFTPINRTILNLMETFVYQRIGLHGRYKTLDELKKAVDHVKLCKQLDGMKL